MSEPASITTEEGSTNVYADLGYTDAAEMQRKSQLAGEIARAMPNCWSWWPGWAMT